MSEVRLLPRIQVLKQEHPLIRACGSIGASKLKKHSRYRAVARLLVDVKNSE